MKNLALEWIKLRSELMGSRGWARMNDRPEPEGADYDYCFFTDNADELADYQHHMFILESQAGWKSYELGGGYQVISGPGIDIGVYPVAKRAELILAYRMRDAGISKDQMVLLLDLLVAARKDV